MTGSAADTFASSCLNGARMPSIADELETDVNTVRLRTTGSRKYGLTAESLELMRTFYQSKGSFADPAPGFGRYAEIAHFDESERRRGVSTGAGRETRTLMPSRAADFESAASADSAIPARAEFYNACE